MSSNKTKFLAAAAQYPIDRHDSWDHYIKKVTGWVDYAARRGAKLAVFPEYGAMELASLNPDTMSDLSASLEQVSALAPHVDALHIELAREHDMHILAASMPVYREGRYRNVARLFTPSGTMGSQEKLVMTHFEREQWKVHAGGPLRLFETELGRIGVLICYDSEFPLLGRALVEAGAEIILVPSCTDTVAGFNRVKIGAMARALEGQCYVVHAATVGEAGVALDVNGPLLAPGLGAQGATAADLPKVFGDAVRNVVPSVSRSVLKHGPSAAALREAAERETEQLAAVLG